MLLLPRVVNSRCTPIILPKPDGKSRMKFKINTRASLIVATFVLSSWPIHSLDMRRWPYVIAWANITVAEFEAHDAGGHTAIHEASMRDRLEIVKTLIQYGVEVDTIDSASNTPDNQNFA